MAKRQRVDTLLVARGLAPDLARARALVMAGQVVAGERRVDKPAELVAAEVPLRLKGRAARAFVSRAGHKLDGALEAHGVDPTGFVCLDVGASTGGFTDCLLQRGAARVYAVDVGHGHLDWRLAGDPRVVNLERTDARAISAENVPEIIDLLVADVSFTSLWRVLGPAVERLRPGGLACLLVKPQFEVAADEVGTGGIVRDPALWERTLAEARGEAVALGLDVVAVDRSVLPGTRGNVEFVLLGRRAPADAGREST
ncbi:MAG: TlyA family RNA methyltransferase [Myxococcales bacterium]|nr:TlyA family RNA methyltransferase [Myxococcales bacterium]